MKNKDLFELFNSLSSLVGLEGVKFNYGVARNINILKPEVMSLQEALKTSEEFNKFDNERVELAKKYAKKDETGKPVLVTVDKNTQYVIEDQKKFDKELEELKETHKVAFEAREKQLKDFEVLLDTENPIKLFKIKLSDVPEAIKTEQLNGIYNLIEE